MKCKFSIGQVLSVAGDKLMCDIGDVYKILNYMTGDYLYTHQLPRAADQCRPFIMSQHPWLEEYIKSVEPKINANNYIENLSYCEQKWGKEIEIEKLPVNYYTFKDPVKELLEIIDND